MPYAFCAPISGYLGKKLSTHSAWHASAGSDAKSRPDNMASVSPSMGVLANVMYNIFNGILDAVGDSTHPLYYLIISSCLNIGLDLLFVAVFHWGVWSAAAATVASQLVSALLCLRHLTVPGEVYQLTFKRLRFHGDMLKQIIKYGLPTGVQYSVIGFANVLVQTYINSFGADAMAGCGAYFKLESFVFVPITSFNMYPAFTVVDSSSFTLAMTMFTTLVCSRICSNLL